MEIEKLEDDFSAINLEEERTKISNHDSNESSFKLEEREFNENEDLQNSQHQANQQQELNEDEKAERTNDDQVNKEQARFCS